MLDDGDSVSEAVARVEILGGPEGAGGGEHAHDAAARLQGGRLDRRLHPDERDVVLLAQGGDGGRRCGVARHHDHVASETDKKLGDGPCPVYDVFAAFSAVRAVGAV